MDNLQKLSSDFYRNNQLHFQCRTDPLFFHFLFFVASAEAHNLLALTHFIERTNKILLNSWFIHLIPSSMFTSSPIFCIWTLHSG